MNKQVKDKISSSSSSSSDSDNDDHIDHTYNPYSFKKIEQAIFKKNAPQNSNVIKEKVQ